MGGGAWPFLVGGVICLVNSVNERDLNLLTSRPVNNGLYFLEGLCIFHARKFARYTDAVSEFLYVLERLGNLLKIHVMGIDYCRY